jgi:hypothetical protein
MEESLMSQFLNPDLHQVVATDRMNELLKEAERDRLTRQANANRPNPLNAVLVGVGDLLISVGKRLQARRVQVAPQPCDVCRADCGVAMR